MAAAVVQTPSSDKKNSVLPKWTYQMGRQVQLSMQKVRPGSWQSSNGKQSGVATPPVCMQPEALNVPETCQRSVSEEEAIADDYGFVTLREPRPSQRSNGSGFEVLPDGTVQRKRRPSIQQVAKHLEGHSKALEAKSNHTVYTAGPAVTKKNARIGLLVVRGPDWKWNDLDGGAGRAGLIADLDMKLQTASVLWEASGTSDSFYRLGGASAKQRGDLSVAIAPGQDAVLASYGRSSLQRAAASIAGAMSARVTSVRKRFGSNLSHQSSNGSIPDTADVKQEDLKAAAVERAKAMAVPLPKQIMRNSQRCYNTREQTIIVFDWDDTLFPTTYVRTDLELSLKLPLKDQHIPMETKNEAFNFLGQCAEQVEQLLRLAAGFGKVVVVTLARAPWVTNACEYFYGDTAKLLKALGVKVVYAQQGEQVDYDKLKMMPDTETERYWSHMKGKAISREVRDFYSQYEGQTWKNVISIGDSDFEREGTKFATEEYLRERGINSTIAGSPKNNFATIQAEVNGHFYKVRRKTFKMVDQPTVEELLVEVDMCRKWLPMMVNLDDGFDVNLDDLEDAAQIEAIEETLRGKQPTLPSGWAAQVGDADDAFCGAETSEAEEA
eukprot:TRINITY_DN6602_c0_g1_i1.p1 TRINITY_DN6602_c0_g1~~TRINITY_DN6602_c0_g1_i1.p1  ORF type:complete len:609 (-),score=161.59 TRINITY_DN6602_c0_g1_i1:203-2029(-)